MDKSHSRLIIILLAGILAVLLLGRDAILGSLFFLSWIGAAIEGVVLRFRRRLS